MFTFFTFFSVVSVLFLCFFEIIVFNDEIILALCFALFLFFVNNYLGVSFLWSFQARSKNFILTAIGPTKSFFNCFVLGTEILLKQCCSLDCVYDCLMIAHGSLSASSSKTRADVVSFIIARSYKALIEVALYDSQSLGEAYASSTSSRLLKTRALLGLNLWLPVLPSNAYDYKNRR
jgi:hypothetical protein